MRHCLRGHCFEIVPELTLPILVDLIPERIAEVLFGPIKVIYGTRANLGWGMQEKAEQVVGALQAQGFQAYFVGGCVRDLLLGSEPKDYDVATDATPDQILEIFPGALLVGAHFGVVIVEQHIEVATFRSDHAYEDGRRPGRVEFESDPRQDVLRRDFTINALLLNPETGEILDFVNGRADLESRLIRAIGEPSARFREDHLRLLRAVRFAARLDFEIEPLTLAAIKDLAPLVARVSAERVRDELSRILTSGAARRGFELLDSTGLLPHILPEISALKGVEQPPEFHPEGDVWTHTLIMLDGLPAGTPLTLALGVLLHDVGKPTTFRFADRIRFDGHVEAGVEIARMLLSRLRYSKDEIAQVEALIANHMRFKDLPNMRESKMKRFLRMPAFDQHLELHRLDCSSSSGHLENYDFAKAKLAEEPAVSLKPKPLLTGHDLITAGYQPGPQFSRMLTFIEDAQLERAVNSKAEALRLLQGAFPVLHLSE
jgi:poly(A) polymerase